MRLYGWRLSCLTLVPVISLVALVASPQSDHHGHLPQNSPAPPAGGAIPMPPDRAADSYAIYSMLMPGQTLAHLATEQDATWAIADVTVNEEDRNPSIPPEGQLKPPPDNPRAFQEAVLDYQANRYTRVQLNKRSFHISHSFELVNPDTAKTSGYPGVTFFSEVYFDAKHDAALVYQSEWCANLCSSGTWIYLEKHGGQWERRSGIVVPGA
jgi:hypothetical protein